MLILPKNLENIYGGGSSPDQITSRDSSTQLRPNTRAYAEEKRLQNDPDMSNKRPRIHDRHQIAALCNIGNTCYLNSVLYTLRFAPNFLRNLHDLVREQNDSGLISESPSNHQIAIKELHELYAFLHVLEVSESQQAYHTNEFLSAIQNVYDVFKGKCQQDAHEFLLCILNSIEEMCQLKNTSMANHNETQTDTEVRRDFELNFFFKDFKGLTRTSTKCVGCETETENDQHMYYLSIPISDDEKKINPLEDPNLFIQNASLTREMFDSKGYRCFVCMRGMEAIRKVSYPVLPRLLIIQLMRFSPGMEKINKYVHTSLTLDCFCHECIQLSDNRKRHVYKLYGIIAHIGAKISSGHYIAFTCSLAGHSEMSCVIETRKNLLNGTISTDDSASLPTNGQSSSIDCCGIHAQTFTQSSNVDFDMAEPTWYMCDDENISRMPQSEFEDLLSQKKKRPNKITPYLLFYARTDLL